MAGTTINERIVLLVGDLKYRNNRFLIEIGIDQSSFKAIVKGTEPTFSTLYSILQANPNLSAEWLMTGQGEMYKNSASNNIIAKSIDIEEIQSEIKRQAEQITRLEDRNKRLERIVDKMVDW